MLPVCMMLLHAPMSLPNPPGPQVPPVSLKSRPGSATYLYIIKYLYIYIYTYNDLARCIRLPSIYNILLIWFYIPTFAPYQLQVLVNIEIEHLDDGDMLGFITFDYRFSENWLKRQFTAFTPTHGGNFTMGVLHIFQKKIQYLIGFDPVFV